MVRYPIESTSLLGGYRFAMLKPYSDSHGLTDPIQSLWHVAQEDRFELPPIGFGIRRSTNWSYSRIMCRPTFRLISPSSQRPAGPRHVATANSCGTYRFGPARPAPWQLLATSSFGLHRQGSHLVFVPVRVSGIEPDLIDRVGYLSTARPSRRLRGGLRCRRAVINRVANRVNQVLPISWNRLNLPTNTLRDYWP